MNTSSISRRWYEKHCLKPAEEVYAIPFQRDPKTLKFKYFKSSSTEMESLGDLAQFVIYISNFIITALQCLLDINYLLVTILIKNILKFTNQICHILGLFGCALVTALEDFQAFVIDLFSGLRLILQVFEEVTNWIQLSMTSAFTQCKETAHHISVSVNSGIATIFVTFDAIANFLYTILCLATRSIILLLEMFPLSIALAFNCVKNICLLIGSSISELFNAVFRIIAQLLISSVMFIHETVLQIPNNAYVGLLIAAASYGLFKGHKSGLIRFPPVFLCICSVSKNYLIRVWTIFVPICSSIKPSLRILNIFTSRRSINHDARTEVTPSSSSNTNADHVKELKEELERQKEQNMCIICQTEPKSVLLLPCRHMCLCVDCCKRLFERRATCPLCRRRVLNPITVYT